MKVANKVLMVTGAGSGIGRQVVIEALRRGSMVAACDINPTTLQETAELAGAGPRLSTHELNVADKAAVEALPAAVMDRFWAVDGIVHCAGIIQPGARSLEQRRPRYLPPHYSLAGARFLGRPASVQTYLRMRNPR